MSKMLDLGILYFGSLPGVGFSSIKSLSVRKNDDSYFPAIWYFFLAVASM
jgi:hypothetical protein